jgi:nicotinate-nucleotide adenylyltransferase
MDQPAMGQPTFHGRRVAFFGGSFDPPHLGHLAVARAAQSALGLDTVLFAPVGAQPLKPLGSTASFADRLEMTRLAIGSNPGFIVSLADAPKPSGEPNFTLQTLRGLRAGLPSEGALFCLMGADSFSGLRRWRGAAEIPFVAPLIVASRPGQRLDDLEAMLPEGLSLVSRPQTDRCAEERAEEIAGNTAGAIEVRRYMLRNPAGDQAPLYLLPGLEVEISASEIREQLRIREQRRIRVQMRIGDQVRIREQVQNRELIQLQDPARAREHEHEDRGQAMGRELLPGPVSDYIRAHGLYR